MEIWITCNNFLLLKPAFFPFALPARADVKIIILKARFIIQVKQFFKWEEAQKLTLLAAEELI